MVGWLVGRIEPFRMVINQGQQCSARKKILQGVRYDDIVWSWEGSRLHHINLELEIGWEKYDNFGCRSSSQGHWWWYYCVAKWNSRVLDTVDTNTTVTSSFQQFSCAVKTDAEFLYVLHTVAHYSKSLIFVKKFNFFAKIFEFLRQNWEVFLNTST